MSETYNIYETKTHLSKVLERATEDGEVTIAKAGKPKWKITPIKPKKTKTAGADETFPSKESSFGPTPGFGENLAQSAFVYDNLDSVADDEIVVTKLGKPIYKIKLGILPRHPEREPGKGEGRGWISDDFDDPLPDEILKEFYGGVLPDWGDEPKKQGKRKKKKK
jgi:prevent-host-death family protein